MPDQSPNERRWTIYPVSSEQIKAATGDDIDDAEWVMRVDGPLPDRPVEVMPVPPSQEPRDEARIPLDHPGPDDDTAIDAELASKACGRLLIGRGSDTWDPTCILPKGHEGACQPEDAASPRPSPSTQPVEGDVELAARAMYEVDFDEDYVAMAVAAGEAIAAMRPPSGRGLEERLAEAIQDAAAACGKPVDPDVADVVARAALAVLADGAEADG